MKSSVGLKPFSAGMVWDCIKTSPPRNAMLLPRKKLRPYLGCVAATAISMPMAAHSIVWWMVAHTPKKNIAM